MFYLVLNSFNSPNSHVDMVKCAQVLHLPNYIHSLDYLSSQQLWYYFLNCVYPNPPCQLSLWEETGASGENPWLLAERWLTLFTWVRSENQTHELWGERRLLWRPRHRSLLYMCRQINQWLPTSLRSPVPEHSPSFLTSVDYNLQ
jgi:hypothetical protein